MDIQPYVKALEQACQDANVQPYNFERAFKSQETKLPNFQTSVGVGGVITLTITGEELWTALQPTLERLVRKKLGIGVETTGDTRKLRFYPHQ